MERNVTAGIDRAAYVLVAGGLLFVFHYHLVGGLLAGLLVFTLLHKTTHVLSGPRLSHGVARFLAVTILGLLAAVAVAGVAIFLVGLVRGTVGELPALFQKMAETLDESRERLLSFGVSEPLLDTLGDAVQLQGAAGDWLKEHALELRKVGGEVGRFLLHVAMGIVVGLLAFFRRAATHPPGPLAVSLVERLRRLSAAFEAVVYAQVEISAINTVLTGVYLFGILPALGIRLPFSATLILVTFVAGLIPVVGNLISNTAIVVISLSLSPWVAVSSLVFLVVVHKLEYFVNAKIVGSRIEAQAWEILLVIVSFEVAFGIAGVVLAPVLYAYVKGELRDRGLV